MVIKSQNSFRAPEVGFKDSPVKKLRINESFQSPFVKVGERLNKVKLKSNGQSRNQGAFKPPNDSVISSLDFMNKMAKNSPEEDGPPESI